jgi:MFS family permease
MQCLGIDELHVARRIDVSGQGREHDHAEDRSETARGARLGWFSSANDVGATAGPLAGGFVLYFTASYSVTYLLVGALGVLTLLMVLLLPDADRPVSDTKTLSARTTEFRQGLAEVLRTPSIFIAAGIEAVMYLGYGGPFSDSCRSTPKKSG